MKTTIELLGMTLEVEYNLHRGSNRTDDPDEYELLTVTHQGVDVGDFFLNYDWRLHTNSVTESMVDLITDKLNA